MAACKARTRHDNPGVRCWSFEVAWITDTPDCPPCLHGIATSSALVARCVPLATARNKFQPASFIQIDCFTPRCPRTLSRPSPRRRFEEPLVPSIPPSPTILLAERQRLLDTTTRLAANRPQDELDATGRGLGFLGSIQRARKRPREVFCRARLHQIHYGQPSLLIQTNHERHLRIDLWKHKKTRRGNSPRLLGNEIHQEFHVLWMPVESHVGLPRRVIRSTFSPSSLPFPSRHPSGCCRRTWLPGLRRCRGQG